MTDDNTALWTPVSDGNDYELAFINVDKESETVSLNVGDEDGVEPPEVEDNQPQFVGTYKGFKDISASDNPDPSFKHLIESERDEVTYALNKSVGFDNQIDEGNIEEGDAIGLDFEGVVRPEDSPAWYNWKVYTPEQ